MTHQNQHKNTHTPKKSPFFYGSNSDDDARSAIVATKNSTTQREPKSASTDVGEQVLESPM